MDRAKSLPWGVNGKEMERPLSDMGKRNFRKMKDLGLRVGLRKFILCCSGNSKLLLFVSLFGCFNCWNIICKNDGITVDVRKNLKLCSKILFLILKLCLILFMETYLLIVRPGSINRQNK